MPTTALTKNQTSNETLREAVFFALAVECLTPQAVASQFGLSGGPREALRIYEEVRIEREQDYENNAAMQRHFGRVNYERVMRTAAESFEESKLSKTKTVERSWTGGENGSGSSDETQIEERVGDPRFLTVQLAALKEIGNLVGAEQPKTINVNTRSVHQVFIDKMQLSDDELIRQAALAQLEQDGVLVIDQLPAPVALPGAVSEPKEEVPCPMSSSVQNPNKTPLP